MRSWLVDCRGIAKKIRHATLSSPGRITDSGAKRECPKCHHWIDNSDIIFEWPGLPAGVKFDPTDVELLEHLAAKCGSDDARPHVLVDEFIPTLDTDKGICYTHPKDLPGASKDGTSVHFFHKTANAYASGQRKRRKIQTEPNDETVRWHKTGKTKPVFDDCIQKGCKKIMVLYRSAIKGCKPVKSNWVMHQYHLGTDEDERDGEYVVSKIFYQQNKLSDTHVDEKAVEESASITIPNCPKTPNMPNPSRPANFLLRDDATDEGVITLNTENQNQESTGPCFRPANLEEEELKPQAHLTEMSQALNSDVNDVDDDLLRCNEIFRSCDPFDDSFVHGLNTMDDAYGGSYSITDLDNIELDTPSDFQDLPFDSQDSIFSWLDRL